MDDFITNSKYEIKYRAKAMGLKFNPTDVVHVFDPHKGDIIWLRQFETTQLNFETNEMETVNTLVLWLEYAEPKPQDVMFNEKGEIVDDNFVMSITYYPPTLRCTFSELVITRDLDGEVHMLN